MDISADAIIIFLGLISGGVMGIAYGHSSRDKDVGQARNAGVLEGFETALLAMEDPDEYDLDWLRVYRPTLEGPAAPLTEGMLQRLEALRERLS